METIGLNMTTAGKTTEATATVQTPGKRIDLGQAILIGSGLAGGGSLALGAIELIRSEPERAFRLLQAWGPYVFIAMFVAWAVFRLGNQGLAVAEKVGMRMADAVDSVAVEQRSLAEAGHKQAMAMQSMADRDDRDKQEMQILIGVVNSKVEQTLDEQKRVNRALERIEDALNINRPKESDTK